MAKLSDFGLKPAAIANLITRKHPPLWLVAVPEMATQAKPTTHLNKAFHLHIGPCIAGRSAHIHHWKHGVHQAGWSISITYDEQWSMTIRSALTKMPNAWIIMNPSESWHTHLQTVQQNEHGTLLLALRVPQAERHFIQNALLRSTLPLRVRRLAYPTRSKTVCIRLYCCRLNYECGISLHGYVYIYRLLTTYMQQ